MTFEFRDTVESIERLLADLLDDAMGASETAVSSGSIPATIKHFTELRSAHAVIDERLKLLSAHIDGLSREVIPTMFSNQNIKTINVLGVGKATVADRWSCSMVNKQRAIQYLHEHDAGGMVQDYVHPGTLGAYAKDEMLAGRPLPEEIFKVSSSPYTSIGK
jgi:hypothetical protein